MDKMGNLLMRNFGKIWDYSGKQSRFGIFWEILGNEKLPMKNFGKIWDYSGKKSRFGIFWEILGNEKLWYCTIAIY